jgi:hypothetical protein
LCQSWSRKASLSPWVAYVDHTRRRLKNGNQAQGALTFRVDSSADTILLINDPNERWHWNDDGGKGLNAKLTFPRAKAGRYDIWMGSLKGGQLPRAKLLITEVE